MLRWIVGPVRAHTFLGFLNVSRGSIEKGVIKRNKQRTAGFVPQISTGFLFQGVSEGLCTPSAHFL